jgi:hypothetical protein
MSSRDLCIMACTFCRDPQFWAWLEDLAAAGGEAATFDEPKAKLFILEICQIESRNELDTNARAAEDFHRLVRVPFLEWKGARDGQ